MGYSEILCHICGVSFNISRIRTEHEPPSAAWSNTGDGVEPFVTTNESLELSRCVVDDCYFVRRSRDESQDDREQTPGSHPERWPQPGIFEVAAEADENEEIDMGIPEDGEEGGWEHIAGPFCQVNTGYSGQNISVEAMRGCNTAQCLVPKPDGWVPESGDQPLEISGDYFLSGLSDCMQSRDGGYTTFFPRRHGIDTPPADNYLFSTDRNTLAMPFHPTCLEIFKRATLSRYGVVDVDCLMSWWQLEWHWDMFNNFPRHPSWRSAKAQWWQHNTGDEFFAANPCFVPELRALISSSKLSRVLQVGPERSLRIGGIFAKLRPATDIFTKLPLEVRCSIVSHIRISDLAELRQASSSFDALPQFVFFEMLTHEMPWFYEAWCSLPISRWATTTASKLKEGEQPDDLQMEALSGAATNWEYLATELVRLETEAPGLKNRKRIWTDCQQILKRVDKYRRDGIKPRQLESIVAGTIS